MLQTEADLLRTLRAGTYTLDELYALCETAVDVSRDNGHSPVSERHRTDAVWKHRVAGGWPTPRPRAWPSAWIAPPG